MFKGTLGVFLSVSRPKNRETRKLPVGVSDMTRLSVPSLLVGYTVLVNIRLSKHSYAVCVHMTAFTTSE